jgi:hypothetical protein
MSHSPCHHSCDWTDGDEDVTDDLGCCSAMPIRRDCAAPTLPVPECDEEEAIVTYDEETEEFTVTAKMYDSECSPLLDSTGSQLLSLIA